MNSPMKTCSKCEKELPANNDFYTRQNRGKHGLKSQCKECDKIYRMSKQSPVIYKITHKDSKRIYIGQTIKPVRWRFSHHFSTAKKEALYPLHVSIKEERFNQDAFEYSILEYVGDIELLNEAEIKWINFYKEEGFKLYNIEEGGTSDITVADTTKKKLSDAHKGKKLSQGHIDKIMEAKRSNGTAAVNKGIKLTKEQKQAISVANTGHKNSVGSKNGMATLSEDVVKSVILLLLDKVRPKEIFEITGVNTKIVSAINRKAAWKHVTIEGHEEAEIYFEQRRKATTKG